MKRQDAQLYTSEIFTDFFNHVIAANNNGKESLYIMATNGTKKYLKLIRCDSKSSILVDRVVDGKEYPAWNNVIPDVASKKLEMFFSMNSFFGERSTNKIHSLQNCWVDVDNHNNIVTFETAESFCHDLFWRLKHDEIPLPYCVFTGRGIHLFWPLIPCEKKYLSAWSCVQKALIYYVEEVLEGLDYMTGWSVDTKVQDVARIMRVPGTFNKSANVWTRFITDEHGAPSTIEHLCSAFSITEEEIKKEKRALRCLQPDIISTATNEDISAAEQRLAALYEFAQRREMNLEGVRNTFTTILASTLATIDPSTAAQKTLTFCKKLQPAQPVSEITATIACCLRYQYKWKNETIAERLGMTREEYSLFTKIRVKKACLSALRKKTKNKTRNESRALRKKKKESLYNQIPVLFVQGYSYPEIAKQLGISLSTVKRHARVLLRRSRNALVKKYRTHKIRETVSRIREGRVSLCLLNHKTEQRDAKIEKDGNTCLLFLAEAVSKWCVNKYSKGAIIRNGPPDIRLSTRDSR
jgi:transposase